MSLKSGEQPSAWRSGFFPIVVAGPSGSGKTTIARALLERRTDLRFSVSATSRPARAGEEDGVDYHFMTRSEFERLVAAGGLLEWAEVHGELYGTPRSNLEVAEREQAHLLLDIDVQGARAVRRLVPAVVTIFLLPPSAEVIIARLVGRGSEDRTVLQRRIRTAEAELAGIGEFDYAVVNDEVADSVAAVDHIIEAERMRIGRFLTEAEAGAREISKLMHRVLSDEGTDA